MPLLSEIAFAALTQYSKNATDAGVKARSIKLRDAIKRGDDRCFSSLAAHLAKRLPIDEPIWSLFDEDTVIVPAPGSAVRRAGSLWVAERICAALVSNGIAVRAEPWLSRAVAVPKSAFVVASDRPTPQRHFETLAVAKVLEAPRQIVVVDDVVTSGAMLLACGSRLAQAFPSSQVTAFALTRAVNDEDIDRTHLPVAGSIRLRPEGRTKREP